MSSRNRAVQLPPAAPPLAVTAGTEGKHQQLENKHSQKVSFTFKGKCDGNFWSNGDSERHEGSRNFDGKHWWFIWSFGRRIHKTCSEDLYPTPMCLATSERRINTVHNRIKHHNTSISWRQQAGRGRQNTESTAAQGWAVQTDKLGQSYGPRKIFPQQEL